MDFKISIADVSIEISSIYDDVYRMCEGYITDRAPDFSVQITQSDIKAERENSIREAFVEHKPYVEFKDSYLETLAVYRKIATKLLKFDAFLMHGAVVGLGGSAYMFTAPSGVGKTTHTRFWLKQFPEAFIVNGDKPIIRFKDGNIYAYGTPWSGKERQNTNTKLPLKSICILTRGKENAIKPITFSEIFPMIFQQTYRPTDEESLQKTMEMIKRLGESVDFYIMKCNLDPNAANVAFEGMNK